MTADHRLLLELVRSQVAEMLGSDPDDLDAHRAFKDMGFGSLATVELRNRLAEATGFDLPVTLAFDHPTPAMVATYLQIQSTSSDGKQALLTDELERLEAMLASIATDDVELSRIKPILYGFIGRLQWFASGASDYDLMGDDEPDEIDDDDLKSASVKDLISLLDEDEN